MKATIYHRCPQHTCGAQITEVDICIGSFTNRAEQEEARKQLVRCFTAIWKACNTKVVFENELEDEAEFKAQKMENKQRTRMHPQDRKMAERARDYLLNNLENTMHLQDLSKIAGMSHTKLNRCFKLLYGMTIFQYLRNERMNWARHLLKDEGMTVTETSYKVGYESISHFSQAYKKRFGISPSGSLRDKRLK